MSSIKLLGNPTDIRAVITKNKSLLQQLSRISKASAGALLDAIEKDLKERVTKVFLKQTIEGIWEGVTGQNPKDFAIINSTYSDWFFENSAREESVRLSSSSGRPNPKGGVGDFVQAMFGFGMNPSRLGDIPVIGGASNKANIIMKLLDFRNEIKVRKIPVPGGREAQQHPGFDINVGDLGFDVVDMDMAEAKYLGGVYKMIEKMSSLLLITYKSSESLGSGAKGGLIRLNAGELYFILSEIFYTEYLNNSQFFRVDVKKTGNYIETVNTDTGAVTITGKLIIGIFINFKMLGFVQQTLIQKARAIYEETRTLWSENESTIHTFYDWASSKLPPI